MNGLKNIREAKGFTQKDLGNKVGVKGNTISQYESGKREPNQSTLKKIAIELDCTIDNLM